MLCGGVVGLQRSALWVPGAVVRRGGTEQQAGEAHGAAAEGGMVREVVLVSCSRASCLLFAIKFLLVVGTPYGNSWMVLEVLGRSSPTL